jgi:hypothetical protein
MINTDYYFESHITIDPILEDNRLSELNPLVKPNGFRVAKLFMQKGQSSNLDSFMAAHAQEYSTIMQATMSTVNLLKANRYGVRR